MGEGGETPKPRASKLLDLVPDAQGVTPPLGSPLAYVLAISNNKKDKNQKGSAIKGKAALIHATSRISFETMGLGQRSQPRRTACPKSPSIRKAQPSHGCLGNGTGMQVTNSDHKNNLGLPV